MSIRTIQEDGERRLWLRPMKQFHLNEGPLEVDVVYSGESKNPMFAARAAILIIMREYSGSLDADGSLRADCAKWVRTICGKAQDYEASSRQFLEAIVARRVALALSPFCADVVAECGQSSAYSLSAPRLSAVCADQRALPGYLGVELSGSGAFSIRPMPPQGKAVCLTVADTGIKAVEANLRLCRLLDAEAPCADALEAVCGWEGIKGALAVIDGSISSFGLSVDTEC